MRTLLKWLIHKGYITCPNCGLKTKHEWCNHINWGKKVNRLVAYFYYADS